MKTAEEKALALLEKWRTDGGGTDEECEKRIVCQLMQLIKEQDRDTRHACADAAMKAAGNFNAFEVGQACMNVKAI